MQSGVSDWILGQKGDTNGENGEIQKFQSLVNGRQCTNVDFFICTKVPWYLSQWGKPSGEYTGTLCAVFTIFLEPTIIQKIKDFFSESIFMQSQTSQIPSFQTSKELVANRSVVQSQ